MNADYENGPRSTNRVPGRERAQSTHLAISTHELLGLWGEGKDNSTPYEAACAVIRALHARHVDASITPGGIGFSVNESNVEAAKEVLDGFQIDIAKLGRETFHQEVARAGGLQNLANSGLFGDGDKSGRARHLMALITGQRN